MKYFDAVKNAPFYRLLGGGVEFGELAKTAIVREIREELSAEIKNVRLLTVVENIFVHEGKQGHEIVFLYRADFVEARFYEQDVLPIDENGVAMQGYWMAFSAFEGEGAPPIYPEVVSDFMRGGVTDFTESS